MLHPVRPFAHFFPTNRTCNANKSLRSKQQHGLWDPANQGSRSAASTLGPRRRSLRWRLVSAAALPQPAAPQPAARPRTASAWRTPCCGTRARPGGGGGEPTQVYRGLGTQPTNKGPSAVHSACRSRTLTLMLWRSSRWSIKNRDCRSSKPKGRVVSRGWQCAPNGATGEGCPACR